MTAPLVSNAATAALTRMWYQAAGVSLLRARLRHYQQYLDALKLRRIGVTAAPPSRQAIARGIEAAPLRPLGLGDEFGL